MKNDKLEKIVTFLYLPLTVIILELMIHFGIGFSAKDMNYPGMICMSVAVSGMLMCICILTKSDSATGWILFAFVQLISLFYCISYFTYDSYKVFMTPSMIFSEAGDVATGFTDTLVGIVTKGAGRILMFEVPSVICLICAIKNVFHIGIPNVKSMLIHLLCTLAISFAAFGISYLSNSRYDQFKLNYEYTEAVKKFGLAQAVILDMNNEAAKKDENSEIGFVIPAVTVQETEKPDVEDTAVEAEKLDYGPNMMDIDFPALSQDLSRAYGVRQLDEYAATLSPSAKNEYTGLLKGKNLILITAESLTKEVVDKDRTPTLYRLANNGIVFEDFYQPAWGGSTSTGEYAFLTGNVPVSITATVDSASRNNYFTLGNQLQRENYFSMAFHNGDYDYYIRNATHPNLGYGRYLARNDGLTFSEGFPTSDLELMEQTVDMYMDNEPFSVYYMTISAHASYALSNDINSMSYKNRDIVEDMPYSETVRAYYAANQELEYALDYLIKALDKKGVLDNTVIALVADHYPYGLCRSIAWNSSGDCLSELYGYKAETDPQRDHSIGLIWSTELEKNGPIVIKEPTSTIDMVPTLSNLFGLEYDSRLLAGRDVFSDTQPLVIWNNGHWLTEKGYYNGAEFIPSDPNDSEDYTDYIKEMKNTVTNKRIFSSNVIIHDYYYSLFGKDDNDGTKGWEEEYAKYKK